MILPKITKSEIVYDYAGITLGEIRHVAEVSQEYVVGMKRILAVLAASDCDDDDPPGALDLGPDVYNDLKKAAMATAIIRDMKSEYHNNIVHMVPGMSIEDFLRRCLDELLLCKQDRKWAELRQRRIADPPIDPILLSARSQSSQEIDEVGLDDYEDDEYDR